MTSRSYVTTKDQAELKPEMETFATMDFYVATKLEKFIKKNVTTFLTHVATLIKHMAIKLMSRHLKYLS